MAHRLGLHSNRTMKINFLEDINPKLPKGSFLTVEPNKTNLVVGRNGSGKTITFSSLVTHLVKQTKQKDHNWMVEPRADIQKKFSFEGFESVNQVVHYTAKIRQSHWVDLDMALSHPYGHMVLNSSEGQSSLGELSRAAKHKDNPDCLFIFDELDGCFDHKTKSIFFDRILPRLKGTKIVCTHDSWFPRGQTVFDFTDGTWKEFSTYIKENE